MDSIKKILTNNFIADVIKEHLDFRKQLIKLALADLKKTYRGAALGWFWAVIKPAITIMVYWFAFTIIRGSGPVTNDAGVDYPYFLWIIGGIIPWFYISEMLNPGVECIRKYSYLVTKMKFPVSTIPTFVSLSKISINIILICFTIVLFAAFGFLPDIYYLQLPYYILGMFLFSTSLTLLISCIAVMSRDFANLVKSFVTAVFWLSAIMWNVETINNPLLKKFLKINPVTYLTNGFRNVYINKVWFFEEKCTVYFLVILAVITIVAFLVYRKVRKDIPDVL